MNPRNKDFKYWGGRGIKALLPSYDGFLAAIGRAPSPQHSVDRIDNDGHYEPSNIRWALAEQQGANKRQGNQWSRQRPS